MVRSRKTRLVAALLILVPFTLLSIGCAASQKATAPQLRREFPPEPGETHFGTLRMLTDGGENAEAYFSFSGKQLIFQTTRPPYGCDQIFRMRIDGSRQTPISGGHGRNTCSFFLPGDRRVLFASTASGGDSCPTPPDMSQGYVWGLFPDYDIYTADLNGSHRIKLTDSPGYDAEATISPRGDRIVFTSVRDGDLELYSMKLDGSDLKRLTNEIGYDGGAFYSPDGSKIVYRASHPTEPEKIADYQRLLKQNLVRPTTLDIWIMNADGSGKRQVTSLNVASFAPYFSPDGKRIIFSSNNPNPRGREFDLWMVDLDGSHLEQITHSPGFDGFPMFSPDGKKLVFCSNRHDSKPGETNVFITDWRP